MKVQLLSNNGKIPIQASKHAAGYDLYSAESGIIEPHSKLLVKTDIAIEIPIGYCGKIESRSSLANRNFVLAFNGVIDADYRGPVGVILMNFSEVPFKFDKHERIAQLVIYPILTPMLIETSLTETERGSGGFGSTGTK